MIKMEIGVPGVPELSTRAGMFFVDRSGREIAPRDGGSERRRENMGTEKDGTVIEYFCGDNQSIGGHMVALSCDIR